MNIFEEIGTALRTCGDSIEDAMDNAADNFFGTTTFSDSRVHQRQARDNFERGMEEIGESIKSFFGIH